MKRIPLLIAFLTCMIMTSYGQKHKNVHTIRITYENSYNNQVNNHSNTVLEISGDQAKISYNRANRAPDEPIQHIFLDYSSLKEYKTGSLKNGEVIYTVRDFQLNNNLTFLDETEKIAGYNCKKATTVINSNRIDIWYTTELPLRGTMQPNVGIPDGIVLKAVRNGQQVEQANKVEILKNKLDLKPDLSGENLTAVAYNYKIQQSRVITVDVFTNQSIYFRDIPVPSSLSDTEVMQFGNGSFVLKKVQLPETNEGYSIFAELSQYAEGDAYDRTGSVFMIPTNQKQSFLDGLINGKDALPFYTDKHGNKYEGMVVTNDYTPPLELMRFFTSFGVRGYNHIQVAEYQWSDSVLFKQEITDYAKELKGEVWIGAWIGNYSENGHNISLKIKYYPGTKKEEKEVYPLFATVNLLEMAGQTYPEALFRNDSLSFNFTTDKPLKDAYIRYISTGHGGWGGGDEFNPKLNEMFLDGERVMAYIPWREDCACYREWNPASGNFANGLSSSDLSRSGWCPGTVSYPIYIPIGDIAAGEHTLKLAIPVGDPAGSSISYWCTSGVLVGESVE